MHLESIITNQFEKEGRSFTENYYLLCRKEKRNYTDEEVALLPSISTTHPHYNEWMTRKKSCGKLIDQIKQKGSSLNILEIGCGNGWLAAKLAAITSGKVTGVDINPVAIKQARRVFSQISSLDFITGDIRDDILADGNFDFIVFAASIQYFPSLKDIIGKALQHLTLQGQIHIVDSLFYQPKRIAAAAQKTKAYYQRIGLPGMVNYHYHHCIDELGYFQYNILYDPASWINKLRFDPPPFHHILIKNRYR